MIVANGYRIFRPMPRNESNAQDLHADTFELLCRHGFRFQTPLDVQIPHAGRSHDRDKGGGFLCLNSEIHDVVAIAFSPDQGSVSRRR